MTLRALFSQSSSVAFFIEFEIALARVQAELGIIPAWAAQQIAESARVDVIDLGALNEAVERTGYPIAPFVRQLAAACGQAGAYVHWGATTQDLLLSMRAWQINQALGRVDEQLSCIVGCLSALAQQYRDTPMAGRGFGGHALPITFGLKLANWLAPLLRHVQRLRALRERPVEGELGGAMGTLASLGEAAPRVQQEVLQALGLAVPLASASSARDAVAEVAQYLALLTASLAKMAQDIAQLMWTEVGELAEPAAAGADASSTLPHKANPAFSWQIMTAATLVQRNADAMLGAMWQEQERSGHGFVEARVIPEVFIETEVCLGKMTQILQGLQVNAERMGSNVQLTRGLIVSESVQMALGKKIGRLRAHDLVHEACDRAVREGLELLEVLSAMPEVNAHLSSDELRALLDPVAYLGMAGLVVDRTLAAARSLQ